jgi:DNA-binding FadR family transcriptional regulator
MERMGLVSHVEGDLERTIVLGLLPKDGSLPSEQLLARRYGVSRATARQALLRLAARGLVVQHPGRRSRAVPLPQAVTLENLSMVLHGESPSHPEGRRLLGGYLALKRETMVELLAACCEQASKEELNQLGVACFSLGQTAPWEDQRRWAEREFELLRLAALIVNRPGQFLLIQSLERSFWAMAGRLLPHLDSEAARQWSRRALQLLDERDVQALRRELPALLQASDEQLLNSVAPAHEPLDEGRLQAEPTSQEPSGAVLPNQSACEPVEKGGG